MGIKNSFFEWMLSWHLNKNESKTLRIIGSNSLKHPSGDIDFVKSNKKEVLLVLNEMSLCGADSPLPERFIKSIVTENEDSVALASFLNTIQHYLAMLRFSAILERSSFFTDELASGKWQNRFALHNERFSLETLRCFFAKMFPDCKIEVHCFEPLRIDNPAPAFLGNAILNGATLLGKSCISLTNAMRVDIYGISLEQSIELKRKKDFLDVRFPFKIKLSFTTNIRDNETCRLGDRKLSEDFWLGSKNFEDFKWEKWL